MATKFATLTAISALGLIVAATDARADGSTSIIGHNPGQQCADHAAEAIVRGVAGRQGLYDCTDALRSDSLTRGDRASTYLNRGVIQEALARHDAAIDDFNMALKLNPGLAEAYVNRGVSLAALDRKADAIADFTQAIALNPARPETVYFDRAVASEDMGNMKAAYQDYMKASRLAPDWAEPKQQLSRFTVVHRQAQG